MSRRPLAPDVWDQALLNGRRIHPSDDAAALRWAEEWYRLQGGLFDGGEPAAAEPAPAVIEEKAPEPKPEAEAPVQRTSSKSRRRARQDDGQFKADDPATPAVNEAWEGGDAA